MRFLLRLIALALLGPSMAAAAAGLLRLDHRWPDLLVQFTAPMLGVAVGLTAVYALLRLRTPAWVGAATTLALSVAGWPQWSPPGPRALEGAETIRLYSANLWVGNDDVEAIAASIAEAQPDLVLLIELNREPGSRLDDILADYPHRVLSPQVDAANGITRSLIASRWPLRALPDRPDGLHTVAAMADTPQGQVRVLGVHLTRPWPYQFQWGQLRQVQALARRLEDVEGPVVVAGDFNSVTTGRVGRMVQADTGLHPAGGWPGTWPSRVPSPVGITIDQVYLSEDLGVAGRQVGQPTGSDHRPVVTDFAVLDAGWITAATRRRALPPRPVPPPARRRLRRPHRPPPGRR